MNKLDCYADDTDTNLPTKGRPFAYDYELFEALNIMCLSHAIAT